MCGPGLGYLPILLVVVATATIFGTYIWAIVKGDVSPLFPYISDTGTRIPESCIFGQFLNISAALCFCTVFVRYKLVSSLGGEEGRRMQCLNKVGLVLGALTALGLSIVANFQETSVEPVHIIGAALVFGLGIVYEFVQTGLSYHMYPEYNGLYVCRVRLTICLTSIAAIILTFAAAVISRQTTPKDKLHWKPEDEGYVAHVISTAGEWFLALTFLAYFYTYIRDFQKISLQVHTRVHVRHLDEEPVYSDDDVNERSRLLI